MLDDLAAETRLQAVHAILKEQLRNHAKHALFMHVLRSRRLKRKKRFSRCHLAPAPVRFHEQDQREVWGRGMQIFGHLSHMLRVRL